MKLLIWLLIGLALLAWFMRAKRKSRGSQQSFQADPPAPDAAERMLPCQSCGLHVPLSEMVKDDADRVYCSDLHRQQYLRSDAQSR